MELDDEDLCRWLLLANEKVKKLDFETVRYIEKLLSMIEEGRDIKVIQRNTLKSLANKFDKNMRF